MIAARGFSPQLSYLKESTTQEAYTMPGEQAAWFRVQGPWSRPVLGGHKEQNKIKSDCVECTSHKITQEPNTYI